MKPLGKWILLALGAALLPGCLPAHPSLRAVIRTEPPSPRGPYPLTVTFDGSASQGPIEQWIWTIFPEGAEAPSRVLTGVRVSHTFTARGRYRVYLEVRAGPAFAQAETWVEVRSKPPVAALMASATLVQEGQLVHFEAHGSRDEDGQVVRYLWDFGDGSWAETSAPEVTHRYGKAGVYEVRLVVADDYGDLSAPATLRVTVYPKGCGSCG